MSGDRALEKALPRKYILLIFLGLLQRHTPNAKTQGYLWQLLLTRGSWQCHSEANVYVRWLECRQTRKIATSVTVSGSRDGKASNLCCRLIIQQVFKLNILPKLFNSEHIMILEVPHTTRFVYDLLPKQALLIISSDTTAKQQLKMAISIRLNIIQSSTSQTRCKQPHIN